MNITGKTNIAVTRFNELKRGDVFYFISEFKPNDIKIYMRCGHTSADLEAVNLETGSCYSFRDNPAVHKVYGDFVIS